MTKFEIECEQSLGWSHSGEVTTNGKSNVELTDEDATGTGECHLHQHHQGKLPDADCRVSKVEQKKRLKEKMNNEIQFILYHLPDEEGKVP